MSYYLWMKGNDNEHLIRLYFKEKHHDGEAWGCACPVMQHLGWGKVRCVSHTPPQRPPLQSVRVVATGDRSSPVSEGTKEHLTIPGRGG